jgi:hypothetical protein
MLGFLALATGRLQAEMEFSRPLTGLVFLPEFPCYATPPDFAAFSACKKQRFKP